MSLLRAFASKVLPVAGGVALSLTLASGDSLPVPRQTDAQQMVHGAAAPVAANVLRLAADSPPVPPAAPSTPEAAPDPLDGPSSLPVVDFVADPLDGAVAEPLLGPAVAEQPYPIVGSDRSRDAAGAPLAHDGDPATVAEIAGDRPTVVLDLGRVRPVAVVGWLQAGATPVVVQRSLLGGVWVTVDRVASPEPGVWQTLEVDWPARYVRLRYGPEAEDAAARLAEVKVYGPAEEDDQERRRADRDDEPVEERVAQSVPTDDERATRRVDDEDESNRGDRGSERVRAGQERRERSVQRARDAAEEETTGREEDAGGLGDRATEGRAEVISEGCGDGTGDCRIEVDVSAGTATCDESGGSGNRAVGRDASAGEGGTCSKDASGGSVEIGDIDP